MVKRIYTHVINDSLYRNSLFLMASTMTTAIFGFAFWIICARLFPTHDIGIATTIISATALITQFSLLGMKNGLIRFLPGSKDKNIQINTGYTIVVLASLLLLTLYIFFLPRLSLKLVFLRENPIYLFLLTIFILSFSLNQIQEGIFVAHRSTGFVFIKSIIWGFMKLVLPFFLVVYGAFGIYSAFAFGSVLSFLLGLFILYKKQQYKIAPVINAAYVRLVGKYALGDYLGLFLGEVPYFILPLIIINYIGPSHSAYYYIDMQIATFLYMIPVAVTQSLLAEGSYDETALKQHVKKAAIFIAILVLPAILLTYFFGGYVLAAFKSEYNINGFKFLQLLAIGSVFMAIISLGNAVMHIVKKNHIYMLCNFISAVLIIALSFKFINLGLIGVGYALLLEQALLAAIYIFILYKTLR